MPSKGNPTVQVRLSADQLARLDERAALKGQSRSQFARDLIVAVLEQPSILESEMTPVSHETADERGHHPGPLPPPPVEPPAKAVPMPPNLKELKAQLAATGTKYETREDLIEAIAKDCHHPINRRLGKYCGQCGRTL
jgi:hypothetical protein